MTARRRLVAATDLLAEQRLTELVNSAMSFCVAILTVSRVRSPSSSS
jgi:hypothetical protein